MTNTKSKILFITGWMLTFLMAPIIPGHAQSQEQNLYQKALELYIDARFEEALSILRNLYPSSRDASVTPHIGGLLAATYYVLGRKDEAVRILQQVYRDYPDYTFPDALLSPRLAPLFEEAKRMALKLDEVQKWNQSLENLMRALQQRNASTIKTRFENLLNSTWTNDSVVEKLNRLKSSALPRTLKQIQFILENFVQIPGGRAVLGVGRNRRRVILTPYRIMRIPVTRSIYADWKNLSQEPRIGNLPMTGLTWREARSFCKIFEGDLPTEDQWEYAARGPDALAFPFGRSFDPGKCNTRESGIGEITPVDRFSSGASPFGILDMCGNTWEWTRTLDRENRAVLKGGSYHDEARKALAYEKEREDVNRRRGDVGFRCVLEASVDEKIQNLVNQLKQLIVTPI